MNLFVFFQFKILKYGVDLRNLMDELQGFYDTATLPELSKDDIVKGRLYALCHSDEGWYR